MVSLWLFAFPQRLLMLAISYILSCNLCMFFGKASVQTFCPTFVCVCVVLFVSLLSFENSFISSGNQHLIKYVIPKDFLPVSGLSFHLFNSAFQRVHIINFF